MPLFMSLQVYKHTTKLTLGQTYMLRSVAKRFDKWCASHYPNAVIII